MESMLSRLNLAATFQLTKRFKNKSTSSSSNRWLDRQLRDPFVKRAVKEGYRARSAFKLIEINEKFKIMKPGDVVVDLGASPGSWSQVAIKEVNSDDAQSPGKPKGLVVSVDRDFIEPLGSGARILSHCDITHPKTIELILKELNGRKVNCVISDMAPNATGVSTLDHDNIIRLQKEAFDLSRKILTAKGNFLCKIWFGDLADEFKKEMGAYFERIRFVKSEASRSESAELFVVCSNLNKF